MTLTTRRSAAKPPTDLNHSQRVAWEAAMGSGDEDARLTLIRGPPGTGIKLPERNLLLASYYLLLATCYSCYLLLATCYLLLTTCYLLLATYYLLPTTYYLLLTTYRYLGRCSEPLLAPSLSVIVELIADKDKKVASSK